MRKSSNSLLVTWMVTLVLGSGTGATARQPAIFADPSEPPLPELLAKLWNLHVHNDLHNPLTETDSPAALFQRADPAKPVIYQPIIALGMENRTCGGWYVAEQEAALRPADSPPIRHELWSIRYKQSEIERKEMKFSTPPLEAGIIEFDPGDQVFGLWVGNESFPGESVFTEPLWVARVSPRLKQQPYKAMIYPAVDEKTGKLAPNSYFISWEYSTNDDFQDVVTRLENVRLLPDTAALAGIIAEGVAARKLADGFKFTEGPAWDSRNGVLYFSDIPPRKIIRWDGHKATVAREDTGGANGLMFDRQGRLLACCGAAHRMVRDILREDPEVLAEHYKSTRLNSPNDLWLDTKEGVYFTDPRYRKREAADMDQEAVYYLDPAGQLHQLITDLVKPNGIAISTDSKWLYVLDNGTDKLYRYPIEGPGRLGKAELITRVEFPDGMTVDEQGRLYVTCRNGVWILTGDGKWIGRIDMSESPSNCTFGGENGNILFITARQSLYAVDTLTRGWHVHLDGPKK
ncbi:MAG: SMP-30/gluconolactonase/LRE family protein [Phycisphaerales bacterium]|nr:SMP-30/gluconolactonase/LRE family protein [Phycisphaerales bacterium]